MSETALQTDNQMSGHNNVVILFDTTIVMPVAEVQPALAAFVNLLQLGDQFAFLGYKGRVDQVFPEKGLATYEERRVLDAATLAIEALRASGKKSNLSAGLSASQRLLDPCGPPKALVLVDASPSNVGKNPLCDLPDFPVEAIAIGDHGQTEMLRKIAQRTGGTYSFASEPSELMPILLDVVERLGIARIVAMVDRTVGNRQPVSLVGRVGDDTAVATFLVYWGDPAIVYDEGPRQVSVEILDPEQHPVVVAPAWAGDGFAVFSIAHPAAGSWTLGTTYVGPDTCRFTNTILT